MTLTDTDPSAGADLLVASLRGTPMPDFTGARCVGMPDMFFATDYWSQKAAKGRCQTCPHLEACRQWAIDTNQEHGIWGGTTAGQRKKIRRGMDNPHGPVARHGGYKLAVKDRCPCRLCLERRKQANRQTVERRERKAAAAKAAAAREMLAELADTLDTAMSAPISAPTQLDLEGIAA